MQRPRRPPRRKPAPPPVRGRPRLPQLRRGIRAGRGPWRRGRNVGDARGAARGRAGSRRNRARPRACLRAHSEGARLGDALCFAGDLVARAVLRGGEGRRCGGRRPSRALPPVSIPSPERRSAWWIRSGAAGGVDGVPLAGLHAGGALPREERRSVVARRVGALDPADARPSCPRCGAACPAGAARCRRCGFAFLDAGERRRLPRPGGRGLGRLRPDGRVQRVRGRTAWALALAAMGAVATIVLIADEDAPPPAATPVPVLPPPPTPISALEAERRLELRFGGASDDETAAVRCPHRIEPERRTRCELRYRNTAPRAILVRISRAATSTPTSPIWRRSSASRGSSARSPLINHRDPFRTEAAVWAPSVPRFRLGRRT